MLDTKTENKPLLCFMLSACLLNSLFVLKRTPLSTGQHFGTETLQSKDRAYPRNNNYQKIAQNALTRQHTPKSSYVNLAHSYFSKSDLCPQ